MNKQNASKLWKAIQKAGDYLEGQLPEHQNHPNGRNPYAHVALCVKEKFDREQKAKEHRENLREQRLRQKELERLKSFESNEKQIDQNLTSGLQNFDVDKTSEN